jgi:hypothetical protein
MKAYGQRDPGRGSGCRCEECAPRVKGKGFERLRARREIARGLIEPMDPGNAEDTDATFRLYREGR